MAIKAKSTFLMMLCKLGGKKCRKEDIVVVLECKELKKRYQLGEHIVNALVNVDFSVEKGEFIAIMGPSGSGKSTLLHLLGGLDKPSDGEIFLAGKNISRLNDKESTLVRRHHVGFVFQFFHLLPTLSAEENVALPLIIDGKDLRKYQDRIDKLMSLVGLADRKNHKPDQLSGGEQQRIAMARALVTEPTIVLADEPTGNLDTKTGKVIMETLRKSCNELNQTIIVVTHDPRAAIYSDRVVFLRDGLICKVIKFGAAFPASERLSQIMDTMQELEL
jgi:putative ABC transport system ATP-binding protein